jgi:hypothetical protein
MMRRRNKVFERYTLISDRQKQFRSWRAWTIILALVAIVSLFITIDWRWHVGTIATAAAFGYQSFVCYKKWKDAQREADSSKLVSSASQEFGAEKLKSGSIDPVASSSATSLATNNSLPITPSIRKDTEKQTPSATHSIRRRFIRGQFDAVQSPDNNPENFNPELAKKFARKVMQSPDKLSPMNTARGSFNDNRFSAFPTTPSMDNGTQDRKPYHVSPLVTDTVKRVSSTEPRRVDALQTIGINSVPDEWIEKLKGNLGAHLYAILKLHDQSVQVIKTFLRQQQEQNHVQADTLAKVSPLLEHTVTYKSVTLDDGTVLTIDAILQYCAQTIAPVAPVSTYSFNMPRPNPQPGVADDILQKYKAAWSFFKLCRHIQEIIQQRRFPETALAAGSNSTTLLGMSFSDPWSKANSTVTSSHCTTLMERLRQLQSSDRKLRIEWQSMSYSRGGFGFGGRNTRDFISGHQEYEMMDQDIVMALFLHRCDDHQTRIITASTSQPHSFSDMHFVCHAEDARQVLQHYHQELTADFDGASGNNNLSSNSRRLGGSPGGSSTLRDSTSQLLNIMLRNYPQPVDETASGNSGALASNDNAKLTQSGRSNSPHYDILRFASHVSHPSHLSQQSWQQMSSIMATMSSTTSHAGGIGGDGGSAPMYLSWFTQYKEILSIENGRNDVFEAIIVFMLIITLTAPANDLEDESSKGIIANVDSDTIDENLHHQYHNALRHIMSLLEGNKKAMMGSEDRATVMMKLRRVFKLKGMGNGAGADARVVRGLFEEVIDVHELRHLMYDFHNLQQSQQQQAQQQQQQLLSQSGLSVHANQPTTSGISSASSFKADVYSPFGSATKAFTGRSSTFEGSSSFTNNLLMLEGYSANSSIAADFQQFLGGSSKSPFGRTGDNLSIGHTPKWSTVPSAPGSSSSVLGGGGGLVASPLCSPPTGTMLFGRGNTSTSTLQNGLGSQPLDISMTPITPGGNGAIDRNGGSGMQGNALRGFNSSFHNDTSFSSVLGTSEKSRLTPFAQRY